MNPKGRPTYLLLKRAKIILLACLKFSDGLEAYLGRGIAKGGSSVEAIL